MRVFVTGSTGFIGTELVKELIAAGHQVRGLTRSDAGEEQLKSVGAEVLRGDFTDLDCLRIGATGMDAVVNLAFNHDDMSKFAQERDTIIEQLKGKKKTDRLGLLQDSILTDLLQRGKVKKHQPVIDRLIAQYRG